jgi:hypothetical protein
MATQDELNKKNEASKERQLMGSRNVMASTKLQREAKAEVAKESERLGLSSSGGDERGGIYDVSTDNYSQPDNNQVGINSDIANKGIDSIVGSTAISDGGGGDGGGIPEGFAEETLDVVNNDNTAGQRVFLTKAV